MHGGSSPRVPNSYFTSSRGFPKVVTVLVDSPEDGHEHMDPLEYGGPDRHDVEESPKWNRAMGADSRAALRSNLGDISGEIQFLGVQLHVSVRLRLLC